MHELANMRPRERAYVMLDIDEGEGEVEVIGVGFVSARDKKHAARKFRKANPDAAEGVQAMLYDKADEGLLEQARDCEADAGGG